MATRIVKLFKRSISAYHSLSLAKQTAFTLAELLIALAILGVIATFTIPKILDSGGNQKKNAITKEAASILSGAHQVLKLNNGLSASAGPSNLSPYLNYVQITTTKTFDATPNAAVKWDSCTGNIVCIELHNGSALLYDSTEVFNDTSNTSAIWFLVDPDGNDSGNDDSIFFALYFNGALRTWGTCQPNTYSSLNLGTNPSTIDDPSWFSWSN